MNAWTTALRSLSGITGATERVRLRFTWEGMPEGLPALGAILLAIGVLAALYHFYRRERGGALRWVPFALRVLAFVLLGALLLRPSISRDLERTLPGRVVVLADRSASMSVRREPMGGNTARAWAAALSLPPEEVPEELSRHEIVRRILAPGGGGLLERLSERHEVGLFTFAEDARRALRVGRGSPGPEPPRWAATGRATDLAGALRRALEAEGRLAAAVALTDGRDTTGGDPTAVAREAAKRGVRLHFVGVGSPEVRPNLAVRALAGGDYAVKGQPLRLRALVSSRGYPEREVVLTLSATDPDTSRTREVARRKLRLGEGESRQVDLEPVPRRAGRTIYSARVAPLPGEWREEDNEAVREVTVKEQKIRVLVVAGAPSRDYRFLKALFRRHPDFERRLELGPEGTADRRDGTGDWDVVLLLDPAPGQLTPERTRELAALVDQEGGGLAFVAGPSYSPERLLDPGMEPLLEMLPVVPDRDGLRRLVGWTGFATEEHPIEATAEHPILDVLPGEDIRALWERMPPLYWALPTAGKKRGATVLLRVADGEGGTMPLAAVQPYGAGRVFFCGSPGTWRWRRAGIPLYERFWLGAVRYCAGGRAARQKGVSLLLEQSEFAPGEAVRIRLRIQEGAPLPPGGEAARVKITGPEATEATLRLRPAEVPGVYEGVFYPERFGRFSLVWEEPEGAGATERFTVRRPEAEFEEVRPAVDLMKRLAELSGGRYFAPGELDELPAAIPDRTRRTVQPGPPRPAWDKVGVLAALLGCLAAEWLLRKRLGML